MLIRIWAPSTQTNLKRARFRSSSLALARNAASGNTRKLHLASSCSLAFLRNSNAKSTRAMRLKHFSRYHSAWSAGLFRAAKWKLKMAQIETECSRNEESRFDVVVFAVHHKTTIRHFVLNWKKIYNWSTVHSRGCHSYWDGKFLLRLNLMMHLQYNKASHQAPTANYDYHAKIKKIKKCAFTCSLET